MPAKETAIAAATHTAPVVKRAKPKAKPKPEPEVEVEISDHDARPWDPGAGYG